MVNTTELENFLAVHPANVRDLAWHGRSLILEIFPDAIEMLDEPARLIGFGTDRSYKGLVCGLALQRTYVNLMFARGAELPDPTGLLEGAGKRARHVKLRRPEDVNDPAVAALLRATLALHRQGQG